jgi:uncharacterized protein
MGDSQTRIARLRALLEEESVEPTLHALRERRSEILAVAERRKASNVRVFGSVSRGDSDVESDVDFLVEMAPGATLFDLIGLEQDLADLLGRPVDVLTENAISRHMREDPRKHAVRI